MTLRASSIAPVTAVAAALALVAGCAQPRSVVLLTVDTLRADRVGLYGGGTLPTPAIDGLGAEGAVFETCVAPFGRTTQSVGTILTGLHPLTHGADGLGMPLPAGVETLAETLRGRGYRTAAFTSNLMLRSGLGFEQGFDVYTNPEPRWLGNSASAVTSEGLAWLRRHARESPDAPFFLWLHYLDPHWPYEPDPETARLADPGWSGTFRLFEAGPVPKPELLFDAPSHLSAREIEHAKRLYDAEIADTDRAIGALLGGLAETGLGERAIVALTSDHGESLGEHDYWFGHGEYLYDETLLVPLVVRARGAIPAGARISGLARLEDLAPTLLELAGVEPPDGLDGRSLARALRKGSGPLDEDAAELQLTDHLLVRDANPRRPVPGREGRWTAVREPRWKLIRIPQGGGAVDEELYDVARDPRESENLLEEFPEEAARLRDRLASLEERLGADESAGDATAADEHLDTLRGLGYAN